MNNKYFYLTAVFVILFGLLAINVFANIIEVNSTINIELIGDNLTISSESNYWVFDISEGNISVELDNNFEIQTDEKMNCSEYLGDKFEKCDNIWSINKRLSIELESCDENKNPRCYEYKTQIENKTSEVDSCKVDLTKKETERKSLQTKSNTCETKIKDMYDKDNINLIFIIFAGIIGYSFLHKKYGKTPDYKETNKRRGGRDYPINEEQLNKDTPK